MSREIEVAEPSAAVGMMYTSGTTGPPKGVVATGYDMAPLQTVFAAIGVKPGETMYTPLPLFHGNALLLSAIGSMSLGAKLALAEKFSASRFWDDCRKYDAVEFNTLGGMISILMKQPPEAERPRQSGARRALGGVPGQRLARVRAALRRPTRRVLRHGRLPGLPAQRRR